MPWVTDEQERARLVSALSRMSSEWYQEPLEWIGENLDRTRFGTDDLEQMALQKMKAGCKVRMNDNPEPPRGLEQRWYAVQLDCDGQMVFFKMCFKTRIVPPNRLPTLCVVRVHEQLEPWKE